MFSTLIPALLVNGDCMSVQFFNCYNAWVNTDARWMREEQENHGHGLVAWYSGNNRANACNPTVLPSFRLHNSLHNLLGSFHVNIQSSGHWAWAYLISTTPITAITMYGWSTALQAKLEKYFTKILGRPWKFHQPDSNQPAASASYDWLFIRILFLGWFVFV